VVGVFAGTLVRLLIRFVHVQRHRFVVLAGVRLLAVALRDGDGSARGLRDADSERSVVGERRGGVLGLDGGARRKLSAAVEREPAAGEAHVEPLVEVPEAVDPDLDGALGEAHLHVAALGAGSVEDDEVGVLGLQQVVRERRLLLDRRDAAADSVEHSVHGGLADVLQPIGALGDLVAFRHGYSSISSRSLPPHSGHDRSATVWSSAMS
jgi:hypothetical protein